MGTSSLRRTAQLRALREDLEVVALRGNVDTRLRRLADGDYDAIVIAMAGLVRLGLQAGAALDADVFVPAAGQGTLALQARSGDAAVLERVRAIADPATEACLAAERALVRALEADCDTPVGAHAIAVEDGLLLSAFVGRADGGPGSAIGSRAMTRTLWAWPSRIACARPAPTRSSDDDSASLLDQGLRRAVVAPLAMSAGRVYLVGAGPGDPGLMTARSLELIASADVILYDRLIPAAALDGARQDALLIDVGKQGGGPAVPQSRTQELLIEHARDRSTVVRLKGGDPFVFGRGGEEALGLREAGIPYEVVPGITAGVAAPAYAGIPVTHRDRASAVAFVTGHEDPAKPETALDWRALAAFPGTLVFYMGCASSSTSRASLIDNGRDPGEPVAVVERGTLPGQRTISGTLADIAQRAAKEAVIAPSITVVGPVAGLADELAWLKHLPLSGITVAVTRARAQASGLARALADLGATVVQAPAIRIEELPGPAPDLNDYDLLCLTSPNGARLLFERMSAGGLDARALACDDGRRDRTRHRRRPGRAGRAGRHRARALRGRGPDRGARPATCRGR